MRTYPIPKGLSGRRQACTLDGRTKVFLEQTRSRLPIWRHGPDYYLDTSRPATLKNVILQDVIRTQAYYEAIPPETLLTVTVRIFKPLVPTLDETALRVDETGEAAYVFRVYREGSFLEEAATLPVLDRLIVSHARPAFYITRDPEHFSRQHTSRVFRPADPPDRHQPKYMDGLYKATAPLGEGDVIFMDTQIDWMKTLLDRDGRHLEEVLGEYALTLHREDLERFNTLLDEHGLSRAKVHLAALAS